MLSSVAMMLAMWTKGPSLPSGIPLPSVAVRPTILASSVFPERYSFSTTPLRMVFISGMPDPMACGARMWTTPVLKRTRKTGRTTQAKY